MWNGYYYSTAGILIALSVLAYENDACNIWILKFDECVNVCKCVLYSMKFDFIFQSM